MCTEVVAQVCLSLGGVGESLINLIYLNLAREHWLTAPCLHFNLFNEHEHR